MPTIICSYCHYVGQGEDYDAQIVDVEIHEENCPERPHDEEDEQHREWKEEQEIQ